MVAFVTVISPSSAKHAESTNDHYFLKVKMIGQFNLHCVALDPHSHGGISRVPELQAPDLLVQHRGSACLTEERHLHHQQSRCTHDGRQVCTKRLRSSAHCCGKQHPTPQQSWCMTRLGPAPSPKYSALDRGTSQPDNLLWHCAHAAPLAPVTTPCPMERDLGRQPVD